jgi:peptidoglycan/xylan/chitin deacetylase (PgdA/CDA1 family)
VRIAGLKSFKQVGRWLRSRFFGSALILGYHRVAAVDKDPYSMCVAPEHLAEHLDMICRLAHPLSLRELVNGLRKDNLRKRSVVLTFDDGYAETLYNVKPLLEQYQVPATVFVTTGYLGREFWWNKLERIIFSLAKLPEKLSLPIDGDIYEYDLGEEDRSTAETSNRRLHLLQSLFNWLLPLSHSEREKTIEKIHVWSGSRLDSTDLGRCLTADELIELATGGLVEIGAHTVTHPSLANLDLAEQQVEVEASKASLETLLGLSVVSFSYPNGSSSEDTQRIVRDAGFLGASASHNDVVWRRSNPFQLPRFWIPNWEGELFKRWLNRWLPL